MISKIDRKILELLQKDARMPITKIAKNVNMSENGVKYRLEKLEEKGIIKRFAVLIDPRKIGKSIMAIFNIEVEPKTMRKSIPLLRKTDDFIKISINDSIPENVKVDYLFYNDGCFIDVLKEKKLYEKTSIDYNCTGLNNFWLRSTQKNPLLWPCY